MVTKKGKSVPKMGTTLHQPENRTGADAYCVGVAKALREQLGASHQAIKQVRRWTGASERTVKYWFSGRSAPNGEHLIALARHSDLVFQTILVLSNRSTALGIEGRDRLHQLVNEISSIVAALEKTANTER